MYKKKQFLALISPDSMYMQQNVTQPLKKNEIIPFATIWTDLEVIILSEVSQTEKDKHYVISL